MATEFVASPSFNNLASAGLYFYTPPNSCYTYSTMQLWFWAAVLATVFTGFSNFIVKIAAKRGYEGGLFSLYGAVVTALLVVGISLLVSGTGTFPVWAFVLGIAAGFFGGLNNVLKVIGLRYIDSAIFFPVFKLLSPLFAIVFGMVFFFERFSLLEWLGLGLGLLVPLLLITPGERGRQVNLIGGLLIVLVIAIFGASSAAVVKYVTILWPDPWWVLAAISIGVVIGSLFSMVYKERTKLVTKSYWADIDRWFIFWSIARSALISVAVWLVNYAYIGGGSLAVVHTIHSMYILIPIVLAVMIYGEHMNMRKAVAVVLSMVALALLG